MKNGCAATCPLLHFLRFAVEESGVAEKNSAEKSLLLLSYIFCILLLQYTSSQTELWFYLP
jgi:hypothetical protein